MGLDAVELVMEVEEEFGVFIPDGACERILTVGQLYEHLLSKLRSAASCPTAHAFYLLRQTLVAEFGVERRAARPSTFLADLLPARERPRFWKRIKSCPELSGWRRVPALRFPRIVERAFVAAPIAVVAVALVALGPIGGLILGVSAALALLGLGRFALMNWARESPNTLQTLADLTRSLAFSTVVPQENPAAQMSKEDVWWRLQIIIAEQLGVPRELVTYQARFVNDLGMD